MRRILKFFASFWALFLLVPFLAVVISCAVFYALVQLNQLPIYPKAISVPGTYSVALVFGAGLTSNGQPSAVLSDRVAAAVDLYKAQKVKKLLMSGDNRFVTYNEPGAMKKLAMQMGVPDADIVLDYGGRRSYDTCYRAKHIFGVEDAIVVTSGFHLRRALYTCAGIGLRVIGLKADTQEYTNEINWRLREVPASIEAWWEVNITKSEAQVMGKAETIVFATTN